MKLLKYITAIAGIVLFFSTCKKYPQGGFQNQAKKHILGNWTLTLYEVDGIDSTELINYNGNNRYKEISFLKHHNKDSEMIIQGRAKSGKAEFKNKNSEIEFYSLEPPLYCVNNYCDKNYVVPEGNYYQKWKIQKLTKNDLSLVAIAKRQYVLKFKRK
ncbi:MAG: hypothetical protein IT237_12730 [Bacteroidia bacterium]|nr:hypothetical protein [Bacteroidia bacterium]